jgi:AraC-like DNA-binding protein
LVFVVRGRVHVATDLDPAGRTMGEWEFVFAPMGTSLSYRAAAGSAILIVRLTGLVPECHVFRINKIPAPLKEYEQDDRIYTLRAGERMRYDIEGLIAKLGDGFVCRNFLQMEAGRIVYLLHAYHSREECIRFFASVVSPDIEFSEFVRLNWVKHQNAEAMAHAMNMSINKFTRRFRSVFGVTPQHWLSRQKAKAVYREICSGMKPLKEVAITYGFTDRSNFFRYCIHNYGAGPGDIRRSLMPTKLTV